MKKERNLNRYNKVKQGFFIFVILLCIVACFSIYISWEYYKTKEENNAITFAQSSAILLNGETIKELSGVLEDEETIAHISIKNRLIELVKDNDDIRFAYFYTVRNNKIYFMVDSEPVDSENYSPPGQEYSEASLIGIEVFTTGETILTKPTSDRWGEWISVFVPVRDYETSEIIAVFGIDYPAKTFYKHAIEDTLRTGGIVLCFTLFIISLYFIYIKNIAIREENRKLIVAEKEKNLNAFRFYSLFNNMTSGVAIYKVENNGETGKDYIVQDFNKASLQMEGKEIHEVVGRSLYDLRPNIDNYGLINVFRKVWETGESRNYPAKVYIDDKYQNYYDNHVLRLPTGEIVAIYNDVTEKMNYVARIEESEKKYRQITENMSDVVFTSDMNLNTTYVSPSIEKMLGESAEKHLKRKLEDKIPINDIIKIQSVLQEELEKESEPTIDKNRSRMVEIKHLRADGKIIDLSLNISFLRDEKGNAVGILGVSRDISEKKLAEQKLAQNEKFLKTILESIQQSISVINEDFTIHYANPTLKEYYKDKLPIEGKRCYEVLKNNKNVCHNCIMSECITSAKPMKEEHKFITAIGERWVEVFTYPLYENDNKNKAKRVVEFINDITERKNEQQKILHLVYYDQLTGLHNRRYYEEKLSKIDKPSSLPLAVVLIDVNGLKITNDAFGHKAGDKLLQKVSNVLKKNMNSKDILARIGGDEFIIVIPNTDKEKVIEKINNINKGIEKENKNNYLMSIAIGFSIKDNIKDSIKDLFKKAEDNMYKHKLTASASMRSKIINLIMNSLFEKNNREMLHSKRVSEISEKIAKAMNYRDEDLKRIHIAGLIHDIGKIGIADNILNKKGKLNLHELSEIKRHPEIGYRILSSANEFSEIAEFVLSHHERWDGKGYPKGLKGEEIPVEARIIAIADAYDAMTSKRTYRKSMTQEEAKKEIKDNAGSQFDPDIAEIFINSVVL